MNFEQKQKTKSKLFIVDYFIFSAIFSMFWSLFRRNKILMVVILIYLIINLFPWYQSINYANFYMNMGYIKNHEQYLTYISSTAEIQLQVPIFFSMITTAVIFQRVSNSYLIDRIILSKYKISDFILNFFLTVFVFSTMLWVFEVLTASFIISISTGDWWYAFDMVNLFSWFLYGEFIIIAAIFFSMFISSLKIDKNIALIIIVILFFLGWAIFDSWFMFGSLFQKNIDDPNWMSNNKAMATLYATPGAIFYLVIDPIAFPMTSHIFLYNSNYYQWQFENIGAANVNAATKFFYVDMFFKFPLIIIYFLFTIKNIRRRHE